MRLQVKDIMTAEPVTVGPDVPFKEVASSIVALIVDNGRFGPQRLVRVPRSYRPLLKTLLVGQPPKPTLDPCTQVWLVAMRRQTEPLGEVGQVSHRPIVSLEVSNADPSPKYWLAIRALASWKPCHALTLSKKSISAELNRDA